MSSKDNNKNINNTSIFSINMNEVFPQDWYINVEKAIDFALSKLGNKVRDPEALIKYIMDYNINERIDSIINENAIDIISHTLNWTNKDYMYILSELYTILDYCVASPSFESYTATVKLKDEQAFIYNMEEISQIVQKDYPNFIISFTKTKQKNKYSLTINKNKE